MARSIAVALPMLMASSLSVSSMTKNEINAAARLFMKQSSRGYDGNLSPMERRDEVENDRQVWRGYYTFNGGTRGYVDLVFDQGRVSCYQFFNASGWHCLSAEPKEEEAPQQAIAVPDKTQLARALMRRSACFKLEVDDRYVHVSGWTTEGQKSYEVPNGKVVFVLNSCSKPIFVTSDCDVGGRHLNETKAVDPNDTQEILDTCTYSLGRSAVTAHWRD
jgi:hypothetical protein